MHRVGRLGWYELADSATLASIVIIADQDGGSFILLLSR